MLWEAPGAGTSQDCFADEIAIDFPSVGALTARACDAFLGEHLKTADPATEISLSEREASRGVVLPLEIPFRGTCAFCGGRGETWTEPCGACCGTGDSLVHRRVRLRLPPKVMHGARFLFHLSSPQAEPVRLEVRVVIRPSTS